MKAFIVYCHPSDDSLTRNLRDEFIKGIVDSGNEYVISDLYKMDFKADMTEGKCHMGGIFGRKHNKGLPFGNGG